MVNWGAQILNCETIKKLFICVQIFLNRTLILALLILFFEDDALIAVCKSGNLPTSPSGKYYKNTLVSLIKSQFGLKKLYTLHRLDRETSGVNYFLLKNTKLPNQWLLIFEKTWFTKHILQSSADTFPKFQRQQFRRFSFRCLLVRT